MENSLYFRIIYILTTTIYKLTKTKIMKFKISPLPFVIYLFLVSLNSYASGDQEAEEKIFIGIVLAIILVLYNVVRDKIRSKKNK